MRRRSWIDCSLNGGRSFPHSHIGKHNSPNLGDAYIYIHTFESLRVKVINFCVDLCIWVYCVHLYIYDSVCAMCVRGYNNGAQCDCRVNIDSRRFGWLNGSAPSHAEFGDWNKDVWNCMYIRVFVCVCVCLCVEFNWI